MHQNPSLSNLGDSILIKRNKVINLTPNTKWIQWKWSKTTWNSVLSMGNTKKGIFRFTPIMPKCKEPVKILLSYLMMMFELAPTIFSFMSSFFWTLEGRNAFEVAWQFSSWFLSILVDILFAWIAIYPLWWFCLNLFEES